MQAATDPNRLAHNSNPGERSFSWSSQFDRYLMRIFLCTSIAFWALGNLQKCVNLQHQAPVKYELLSSVVSVVKSVPIEVIEWQPSYAQTGALGISGGEWNPNWEATQSSKCAHLVKRLQNIISTQRNTQPKAIVFSLFWHHRMLIERTLKQNNIAYCPLYASMVSRWDFAGPETQNYGVLGVLLLWPIGLCIRKKEKNLCEFRDNPDMHVLLMDESGAVGLDLSMVCWVFLMEPLADKSLEEQIVSRAHRMGARDLVHVEVLVMKDSAEELLVSLCEDEHTGKLRVESLLSN